MPELPLSPREKRFLRRMAKGMSDEAVAMSLGGRPDQVRDQRARLVAKLGINSQQDLIDAAVRLAPWSPAKAKPRPVKFAQITIDGTPH